MYMYLNTVKMRYEWMVDKNMSFALLQQRVYNMLFAPSATKILANKRFPHNDYCNWKMLLS